MFSLSLSFTLFHTHTTHTQSPFARLNVSPPPQCPQDHCVSLAALAQLMPRCPRSLLHAHVAGLLSPAPQIARVSTSADEMLARVDEFQGLVAMVRRCAGTMAAAAQATHPLEPCLVKRRTLLSPACQSDAPF